jgi:hypothetical protein
MSRLISTYDKDDLSHSRKEGMIFGGVLTGIAVTLGFLISTIDNEESARLARIGRTHERIVRNVRDQFKDIGRFFVMHDEKNPAHLCYIDTEGHIVYSITIAQIDINGS